MKAILEFDLPEDADDHRIAVGASETYYALADINQNIRTFIKYGHEFKTADEVLYYVRSELAPLLET